MIIKERKDFSLEYTMIDDKYMYYIIYRLTTV